MNEGGAVGLLEHAALIAPPVTLVFESGGNVWANTTRVVIRTCKVLRAPVVHAVSNLCTETTGLSVFHGGGTIKEVTWLE